MAEAVASVASIVAGGAASAAVGGGVIGAVVGGIVSVGVSYVAREIMGPTQPQQRSYPTPTPPPPRIYTPPPAPAPVPVVRPAPYQAPYQAPYHTQSVAPSLAPTLAGGGLTQMMRQPVTAHRIVYGEVRVGGPVVYLHTRAPEGSDKLDILHLVVVLAAHKVDSIGDIFLSDQVVALDADGAATGEPFKREDSVFARFRKHLGAANQAADSVLIANSDGQWTGANRLAGRAYVHAELTYDDKAFPSGIPNLSALVRGRKLYDPRTGATAWSDNPALVVLDYLMAPWGLAAPLAEIDVTSFIAAANICDETVERPGGNEKRYTCNGVLDVSQAPQAALPPLLTSCAGRLTYTAGCWRLFAGAYLPPMTAFSEADARDTVTVKPRRSRRDLINTVRGTFISPAQNWQPTDYPPVCGAAYKASDGGEEVAENLDLPYTRSPYMAQRIARIALETCRRELTVQLPANLAGLRVVAGETVTLTLSRFNIVQVPMVVVQWQLTEDLGVNLTLHREDPDIYAIALGDLVTMPAPAAVSLPGNQDIAPAIPTGLAATLSGNAVRLTWSAVAEPDFSLSVSNLGDCSVGLEIIISAACGAISSKNFYLGDLQLVAGSLVLPMAPRPIATETLLVARYLRPCSGLIGKANSATNMQIPLSHPDMRTTPSYEATGALNFTDAVASDFAQSQAGVSTVHDATTHNGRISCGFFSGLTSGTLLIQRGSGGTILASAEL